MVGVASGKALLSDGGAGASAPCSDSIKMLLWRKQPFSGNSKYANLRSEA